MHRDALYSVSYTQLEVYKRQEQRCQFPYGFCASRFVGIEVDAEPFAQGDDEEKMLGGCRRGTGAIDAEIAQFCRIVGLVERFSDAVSGEGGDVVIPVRIVFEEVAQPYVALQPEVEAFGIRLRAEPIELFACKRLVPLYMGFDVHDAPKLSSIFLVAVIVWSLLRE